MCSMCSEESVKYESIVCVQGQDMKEIAEKLRELGKRDDLEIVRVKVRQIRAYCARNDASCAIVGSFQTAVRRR